MPLSSLFFCSYIKIIWRKDLLTLLHRISCGFFFFLYFLSFKLLGTFTCLYGSLVSYSLPPCPNPANKLHLNPGACECYLGDYWICNQVEDHEVRKIHHIFWMASDSQDNCLSTYRGYDVKNEIDIWSHVAESQRKLRVSPRHSLLRQRQGTDFPSELPEDTGFNFELQYARNLRK